MALCLLYDHNVIQSNVFYDIMCFHKNTLAILQQLSFGPESCHTGEYLEAVLCSTSLSGCSQSCRSSKHYMFTLRRPIHITSNKLQLSKTVLKSFSRPFCDVVVLCRVASIICPTLLSYHRVVKKSRSHCKKFWANGIL